MWISCESVPVILFRDFSVGQGVQVVWRMYWKKHRKMVFPHWTLLEVS